jgi:hypothetical protein
MPTHEHIIGELYLQLQTAHDEIDQLHERLAQQGSMIDGLRADINGMSLSNPLGYAYACEDCEFETDDLNEMSYHSLNWHDACDPHGVERPFALDATEVES